MIAEGAARPTGRFPHTQRVRKRTEFQEIQSHGRKVTTPGFVLLVLAREPGPSARLGVTASKRIGSAVVRGRAKRLIREAFRSTRDLWPADIDLVVIARHAPGTRKRDDVVAEWRSVSEVISRRITQARRDREKRHSPLA